MAIKIKVRWIGDKEAKEFFANLDLAVTDRVLKSAGKKAVEPVRQEAIRLAPLGDPIARSKLKIPRKPIKESIKTISTGSVRRSGGAIGAVSVGALRKNPYRAFHANFLEQYRFSMPGRKPGGWYAELIKRNLMRGNNKQWKKPPMPPRKFVQPAIASKRNEVINRYASEVDASIKRLMKRYLRKGIIK